MNNQELELKVKEILAIENFFDMMEAAIAFEKEYKTTDFFKKTKMSLMDVIKASKAWYILSLEELGYKVQKFIDSLDFSNISSLLGELSSVYEQENEETLNIIKEFKDIVK